MAALVPAKVLGDTAKSLTSGDTVTLALSGSGNSQGDPIEYWFGAAITAALISGAIAGLRTRVALTRLFTRLGFGAVPVAPRAQRRSTVANTRLTGPGSRATFAAST